MGCCTSGQKPDKKVKPIEPEVTGNLMSLDIEECIIDDLLLQSPKLIIHNLPQLQENKRYQLDLNSLDSEDHNKSLATTPTHIKRHKQDDPLRKPITKKQNFFD